jgi:hypothetical protein
MREFWSGFLVGIAAGTLLYAALVSFESPAPDRIISYREAERIAAWSCRCDTCCETLDRLDADDREEGRQE